MKFSIQIGDIGDRESWEYTDSNRMLMDAVVGSRPFTETVGSDGNINRSLVFDLRSGL